MKLVVLVDNNTYIDQYYLGEPAVSYYMEDEGRNILFDTGYSRVFMTNAKTMGIDLANIDALVISHGHNDHTGGLSYVLDLCKGKQPLVVAHPTAFEPKQYKQTPICSPVSLDQLLQSCRLKLSSSPVKVSENLTFLGQIPQLVDFEPRKQIGQRKQGDDWVLDEVEDDSALVYHGSQGLVIITGCSHSGICNIIQYARQVCKEDRIYGVIGGFHLFDTDLRTQKTISFLESLHMKQAFPCHCTSMKVRAAMWDRLPMEEVGVGLQLNFT